MDAMLALMLFYWRPFATRRAVQLRKHRRLFEAQQRLIEVARRQLRRQRRQITIVIASVSIVIFTLSYR